MIAVLLATYNGEKYIREQLESIVQQTYSNFICYVHDDGSKDETVSIIKEFKGAYPDRLRIMEFEKTGSSKKNFLEMLKRVEADLYFFADQDDIWEINKIEQIYKKYKSIYFNSVKPVLFFSDMYVVDERNNLISDSFLHYCRLDPEKLELRNLIVQNVVAGCSCMINEALKKECLKFQSIDNIIQHDWWMAIVASATGEIQYIDHKYVRYRQHADNLIGAQKDLSAGRYINYISNIFRGNQILRSKKRTEKVIKQAIEMQYISIRLEKDSNLIKDLEDFESKRKTKRVWIFIKHRIYRCKRNLWMYLTV
ncbi:glycosyltransferase family 2 protein [Butyrivibrio sp. XPD2002]|uniref:glycosyltransferase family 2 protein n=1 Tax=Butyrivibrio sp. XPD2002 TaxID=1280665 RepID=UPI00040DD801|nr:glycosyltransferase family 2 protein [Butyrivibrio sp. XPD2002]